MITQNIKTALTLVLFSALSASARTSSKIEHLVVIIQENHTFDNYFGNYCTAAPGSNPTCSTGPKCCEAAPREDRVSGKPATVLTDEENAAHNPNHDFDCEVKEIDGGKMDHFVIKDKDDKDAKCANPRNFAIADTKVVKPYHDLAKKYAIADHFFQPIAGASSSNDMYLARAGFVFTDNDFIPDSFGEKCSGEDQSKKKSFDPPTIGHLLKNAGVSWSFYAEGYREIADAESKGTCPKIPDECLDKSKGWPCYYDPSDNPFSYYADLRDKPEFMRDFTQFETDLAGTKFPAVSFIKAIGYRSEHPGHKITISAGASFVENTVQKVLNSKYGKSTLILVIMDEGGGYFDHIAPPATNKVDGKPYGTRIPVIAVGPFARKNFISHVEMEHSSIVKFIEWNWLNGKTGQLGTRDKTVNNIGSLLDRKKTGVTVPQK